MGATIVTHGLNARPGGVEVAVALGVTAAYLLVFLRMASLEERSHLIEYGVVGVFIYEALAERASQGRRVPALPLLAVLATAALGLLDECIQAFLPSRVFDSIRHPVQPARERAGGGCERRAGVGAAVDEVPPGAPSRRPISIAGKSWTCPPWFGCGDPRKAAAAASSESAKMIVEPVADVSSARLHGSESVPSGGGIPAEVRKSEFERVSPHTRE